MSTFELFLAFVIVCFIIIAGKVYFTLPLDASRYIRGFWSFGITFLIIYFIAIVTLFDFNRIVEPFLLYFSPNINMPVILILNFLNDIPRYLSQHRFLFLILFLIYGTNPPH